MYVTELVQVQALKHTQNTRTAEIQYCYRYSSYDDFAKTKFLEKKRYTGSEMRNILTFAETDETW